MNAVLALMQNGGWLTRDRMRLWALALLAASIGGVVYLLATSNGVNDYQGRPIGTDFSNIYAGGTYVLDGRAGLAFDPPAQHAREREIFGEATPFYGWCYPPFLLFVSAVLALMPYVTALMVWQGVTMLLYLFMVRAILRGVPAAAGASPNLLTGDPLWLLLALAYPAVFVNLGHGHNGFLTATLLGTGLLMLDRRPVVAGILFGLMSYKPQFGAMIPLVLIVTGRWRAFASATGTVMALVLVSTLAFGVDVWRAFADSMPFTREVVLEQGGTGWHKIQTVFSMVRMWGGSVPTAYAVQGAVTITLAGMLIWLWRSHARYPLKAAALTIASFLATPYSLDYDFVALAPAIAFLAADGFTRGFSNWEKTALAVLWFMPLVARTLAEHTLIPLGVFSMMLVLALIARRAAADVGGFSWWRFTAQPIK